MEEEIDLRPYIKALFRSWYWIVAAALIAGGVAYWISSLMPDVYEAEAAVAIVRERTNVSFNTSIETQEDVLGSRDVRSRLDGLVALVTSNSVAAEVLSEIGSELEEKDRNVPALLGMIEASNTGDLIIIKAKHTDPELASRIANLWAQTYESQVNAIYVSGTSSNRDVVAAQLTTAEGDYETAQADYEAFVGDNRITLLQNEIAAQEALLTSYQGARNKIQSNPVDFQVNTRQEILVNYYADLGNIELWLADARALREQVQEEAGSTAANVGNALALISLRHRIFGGSDETIILQLDLASDLQEPVQLADVDAVITVLETRRVETQAAIETLSISFAAIEPEELTIDVNHPISQRITELNTNLMQLRAELADQGATQKELVQARDLAWETYQSLAKKQVEVEIAAQSTGTEVRVASNSAVPDEPSGTSGLMLVIAGGVVGGMLAVFMVTAVYWWSEPAIEVETPSIETPVISSDGAGKRTKQPVI